MSELYLSRMVLNPRSRRVWRDLSDCYEMHRTVMNLFDRLNSAREDGRVLYRVEAGGIAARRPFVLLQSPCPPSWQVLPDGYLLEGVEGNPDSKRIDHVLARVEAGACLRFRLRANPTRKIRKEGGDEGVVRPARVDIRGSDRLVEWIGRKARQGGFDLLHVDAHDERIEVPDVRSTAGDRVRGKKRANGTRHDLTFAAVVFDGHLRVREPAHFVETVKRGIGSAKGFGFGLLSLAPARME
jgi:CRISPR system Cascade subunit CasE